MSKNPDKPNAVLIFSGGLDSTVALYHLRATGYTPLLLSFNYGQRHVVELAHARKIANLNPELLHLTVDLPFQLFSGSSQTSSDIPVPQGHYAEETMKATVIPNRNMVMLALAGALAISRQIGTIVYAAHAGDHAIYPDCRPEFVSAMDTAFYHSSWEPPRLVAPFLNKTKAEIVARGATLGVPFHLTWSCYEGGKTHCGKCGTCVERREAFQLAGVVDPTEYAG